MRIYVTCLFVAACGLNAEASTVNIVATQVGDDVQFVGTGSIDTTGLVDFDFIGITTNRSSAVRTGPTVFSSGGFGVAGSAIAPMRRYGGTSTGPIEFDFFTSLSDRNFNLSRFTAETGDPFVVGGNGFLRLPSDYVSGDPLNFTWLRENRTLAQLELNVGTIAEFSGNTITLTQIPAASIPEPSTLALIGLGTVGSGLIARRRRD
ncbi:MAG: PEP-CTERM sorting domain-containing protein [Planctomycetota bacterium]